MDETIKGVKRMFYFTCVLCEIHFRIQVEVTIYPTHNNVSISQDISFKAFIPCVLVLRARNTSFIHFKDFFFRSTLDAYIISLAPCVTQNFYIFTQIPQEIKM